jgi:DNA-binding transcriptional LysR family regulator
VAEELNFRRAAERLHMAQPPLTTAIQRLEQELCATLIERTNRVSRLTEAGRLFLEEARRTVAQAEQAVRVAQRAGAGLTGLLRVTFVPAASGRILPPILRAFRRQHPEVQLELREAMTAQQIVELQEDRADIGFVIPPLRDAAGLSHTVIARNQMVAALPQGHRLARGKSVMLADLAREPWVMFPARRAPGLHQHFMAACAQAGFVPNVEQEALQMDTIVSLVSGGMGVAMVTQLIATPNRRGVVFRPLAGAGTPVEYELAIAHARTSPAVEAFGAMVRGRVDWGTGV